MMSEIVQNEIQIRIKSRTGIHCTNNAYVYLPHMCCESAAERVSQEEQLHCSKEMLVASHPSWLIATQQICDRCFQICYCLWWFATMDVQHLQRVLVVPGSNQWDTRVTDWQSQLFEAFFVRATVSSSACTHWSRSGSTPWPTDCSNCIERLRRLTLFNLWLSWGSPWITTFSYVQG